MGNVISKKLFQEEIDKNIHYKKKYSSSLTIDNSYSLMVDKYSKTLLIEALCYI